MLKKTQRWEKIQNLAHFFLRLPHYSIRKSESKLHIFKSANLRKLFILMFHLTPSHSIQEEEKEADDGGGEDGDGDS